MQPAHTKPLTLPCPHIPSSALSFPSPQGSPQVHFASQSVAGLQPATGIAQWIPAVLQHPVLIRRQWREQL